nr:hypothetical protein [Mesonia aestuariivivens]
MECINRCYEFSRSRTDVPGFADQLKGDDRIVLSFHPGITGCASIAFKNGEELPSAARKPRAV